MNDGSSLTTSQLNPLALLRHGHHHDHLIVSKRKDDRVEDGLKDHQGVAYRVEDEPFHWVQVALSELAALDGGDQQNNDHHRDHQEFHLWTNKKMRDRDWQPAKKTGHQDENGDAGCPDHIVRFFNFSLVGV